jgi:hypothetical protein
VVFPQEVDKNIGDDKHHKHPGEFNHSRVHNFSKLLMKKKIENIHNVFEKNIRNSDPVSPKTFNPCSKIFFVHMSFSA